MTRNQAKDLLTAAGMQRNNARIAILALLAERGPMCTQDVTRELAGNYRAVHRTLTMLEIGGLLRSAPEDYLERNRHGATRPRLMWEVRK